MMKRFAALLLSLILLIPANAPAELDEDDLSIEEFIDLDEPEDGPGIVETDGSTTITITCTGDFTKTRKKRVFTRNSKKTAETSVLP